MFLATFAEIVLWNGKGTRVCNRRGRMQGFTYSRVERNWWHYLDDEMYLTLSERKVAGDITTLVESRPCNILSAAGPRQFFVTEQKRVSEETLLVNLTGLANNSTQLAFWVIQRLLTNISRRFSTYFETAGHAQPRPKVIAWTILKLSEDLRYILGPCTCHPFSGSKYHQLSCRWKSISVLISHDS